MNSLFQNALTRKPNSVPPIWMMRQAGRYHSHYQKMKQHSTFSKLCLTPSLAAEVALGPIEDFDFDVAILFSDILFPLMAMGVDLIFEEFGGPHLRTPLSLQNLLGAPPLEKGLEQLQFQKEAMIQTRKLLPSNKSLIGFVGGPWTLFTFATQGTHKNGIREAKRLAPSLWQGFEEIFVPLLIENIRLQFEGGAEVVMILDTAAGDLGQEDLLAKVQGPLRKITEAFPGKIGYYAKGLSADLFVRLQSALPGLAGFGVDQRVDLMSIKEKSPGFIQGNFDPELILLPHEDYLKAFDLWWSHLKIQKKSDLTGWICGLGHGILPTTPEKNVRHFVQTVRKNCQELRS